MPKFQKKVVAPVVEETPDVLDDLQPPSPEEIVDLPPAAESPLVAENREMRARLAAMEEMIAKLAASQANVPAAVAQAPALSGGVQELATAITDAITQSGPRRFIPFGQEKITSPFNKSGVRERKLHKKCMQNGYTIPVALLFDEEIALLAQIQPGRYLDNLVRVIETEDADGGVIDIRYKNQTADQRMALGSQLNGPGKTGFERLLRLIVSEKKQQVVDLKASRRKEIREALTDEE